MALNMTNLSDALKMVYSKAKVEELTYENQPFFGMLNKKEEDGGSSYAIAVKINNAGGRSASFSEAVTQSANARNIVEQFIVTRVKDYAVDYIENEVIKATKGNEKAFLDAFKEAMDGVIARLKESLCHKLFRDKSGYIAQVGVEPTESGTDLVIAVANLGDISGVKIGDTLVCYSAKSGGSQRTSDGTTTDFIVTSVDEDTGTFGCSAGTYTSSGTIAANDYLFIKGDRGVSVSGLEGWIPYTAPTSGDSFFGVDRSVDPVRLAGVRLDASSETSHEKALIKLASKIGRMGFAPDVCIVSFIDFAQLEIELGAKVRYSEVKASEKIGYNTIILHGPSGTIKVIADHNCPQQYAYMLTMKSWYLNTLGKAIDIINTDGLMLCRVESSDSFQVRAGFYGNLICNAPGQNGVVKLPVIS